MKQDKNNSRVNNGIQEPTPTTIDQPGRRRLLTAMGIGSAIVGEKILPESWARPIIDSMLLPAHAQCSLPLIPGTLSIDIDFDSDTCVEFAIEARTPCGGYLNGGPSTTLIHDATPSEDDAQNLKDHASNIDGMVAQGKYRIYCRLLSAPCEGPSEGEFEANSEKRIIIRTAAGPTPSPIVVLGASALNSSFSSVGDIVQVAEVVFPGGTVTASV